MLIYLTAGVPATGTQRSLSECQKDALEILQQPRTSILDNHTKIFILLAQRTVISGRELAVLISDIKLPFPKKDIVRLRSLHCVKKMASHHSTRILIAEK